MRRLKRAVIGGCAFEAAVIFPDSPTVALSRFQKAGLHPRKANDTPKHVYENQKTECEPFDANEFHLRPPEAAKTWEETEDERNSEVAEDLASRSSRQTSDDELEATRRGVSVDHGWWPRAP